MDSLRKPVAHAGSASRTDAKRSCSLWNSVWFWRRRAGDAVSSSRKPRRSLTSTPPSGSRSAGAGQVARDGRERGSSVWSESIVGPFRKRPRTPRRECSRRGTRYLLWYQQAANAWIVLLEGAHDEARADRR